MNSQPWSGKGDKKLLTEIFFFLVSNSKAKVQEDNISFSAPDCICISYLYIHLKLPVSAPSLQMKETLQRGAGLIPLKEYHYLGLFQAQSVCWTFSTNFNELCFEVFMQRVSTPNCRLEQPAALAGSWKGLPGILVTLIKTQRKMVWFLSVLVEFIPPLPTTKSSLPDMTHL